MNEKAAKAQCQTPIPTRKRGWAPGSVTPNVFSAAKRRRMSLADEDSADFEGFASDFGSTSKVDVVRISLVCHGFLFLVRVSLGLGAGVWFVVRVRNCGWLRRRDMSNHLWRS